MIFDKLNASDEVYGLWQQPCFNETLDCTGLVAGVDCKDSI